MSLRGPSTDMSFILQRTQNALVSAMIAKAWSWPRSIRAEISRGQRDDDDSKPPASNELPAIIVSTPTASQYTPHVANFDVEAVVMIRHSADDTTQDDHLTNASEVSDWILGETFFADINAQPGFTAFGRGNMTQDIDRVGRLWQATFRFNLSAAPSNI